MSDDDLETQFKAAADTAKNDDSFKKANNDQKLQIYALFKQSTEGDVQGSRPGMLQMTARAKYDEWKGKEGMSKEDAKKEYVALVEKLKVEFSG